MKRILITGASGFIGKHVVAALRGSGDEIHTVQHTARQMSDSRNHTANLMDPVQVDRLIERVKPTHLVHLAWYAEHGKFWTSPLNLDWVAASLKLFQSFVIHGGQRAVFAGTCAEYDWTPPTQTPVLRYPEETGPDGATNPALRSTLEPASPEPASPEPASPEPHALLNEQICPSRPNTLYGVCKNALREVIESYAVQASVPVAWGRLFFLYGPDEHKNRLVPSILQPLLNDEPAIVRSGAHLRNLMHVEDVARAFVTILNSPATGIVNIAGSEIVSLGEVANMLGALTGKSHLLQIEQAPGSPQNPRVLLADTAKLCSLGFAAKYSLQEGLSTLIATESKEHS